MIKLLFLSLAAAALGAPAKEGYGDVRDYSGLNSKGEADHPTYRVRRDAPPSYGPPAAPAYHPAPHHAPGRVGPVYTFVKTDPQANFKLGVRHRAGAQYGKREARPQGPEGPLPIPRERAAPSRQARQLQEDLDSYQSAPYSQIDRDDSAPAGSGPPAYGPPAAAPHAGPD